MVESNRVLEETVKKETNTREERLQLTIEEYNYNNYVEYINRKEKVEDEDPPRVIIIDLWYNIIKKGKKWLDLYKT